jgi:hypothetical protein
VWTTAAQASINGESVLEMPAHPWPNGDVPALPLAGAPSDNPESTHVPDLSGLDRELVYCCHSHYTHANVKLSNDYVLWAIRPNPASASSL